MVNLLIDHPAEFSSSAGFFCLQEPHIFTVSKILRFQRKGHKMKKIEVSDVTLKELQSSDGRTLSLKDRAAIARSVRS